MLTARNQVILALGSDSRWTLGYGLGGAEVGEGFFCAAFRTRWTVCGVEFADYFR